MTRWSPADGADPSTPRPEPPGPADPPQDSPGTPPGGGGAAPPGRALALDLGSRRVGVAVSDAAGTLATPYEVIERSGDHERDHRRVAALVDETGAVVVVVGLPRSLDGSIGSAARTALDEVDALRARLPVPVVSWDERLSTVEAERSLRTMGVRGRTRRRVVDQLAATVILQSWLDAGRPHG